MCNIIDVEKYIYNYCNKKGIDDLSNKKLQKLLYYLQAWFLVKTGGETLFDDKIEAWLHGPVVAESYHRYKQYSFNPIFIDVSNYKESKFIKENVEDLDDILDNYAECDADYLEVRTHIEGPWLLARKNKTYISNKSMLDYYTEVYNEQSS